MPSTAIVVAPSARAEKMPIAGITNLPQPGSGSVPSQAASPRGRSRRVQPASGSRPARSGASPRPSNGA